MTSVFHPDPAEVADYATGRRWQQAAHGYYKLIEALPVSVRPRIEGELAAPCWNDAERLKQEEAFAGYADWLANALSDVPHDQRRKLDHPDGRIRFHHRAD